ncbi:GHKL domain protein [Bacteriovorax sp. BAL6_X]|uniref:sensor histidine kinase n=1 Tax=Bacteriovorax sp. BAL6_X TaxID=1201290 RepID=UPI00038612A4|nr:HAMP domain-containing sensor histidine kinase [Bacteriovorax sp. BAL6_X]EPZ50331.1 GHKL domain protein [Bacteriovorax sp. BAL6_X]
MENKFQDSTFITTSKKNSQLQIKKINNSEIELKVNSKKFVLLNSQDFVLDKLRDSIELLSKVEKEYQFKKKDNIRSFLKYLTTSEGLNGFSSAQILIHQKGTTNIYSITYKNDEYYEAYQEPTFFNTLFAKVRKSKNKSFDQKELLNKDIQLDGHFLAKELSFRDYNLIILLSRNDLFPIADIDRSIFNDLITKSIPKLFNIITIESSRHSKLESDRILKNFPIDSFIIEEDNVLINQIAIEDHQQDTSSLHHERILLMGELLNTLRHELSNPLFGIDLSHNLLIDQTNDLDIKDTLSHISNSVKRSQAIIQEFSNLYKDDEEFTSISLKNLISETIILTKSESRSHKVNFRMENDIEIMSNGTLLSQVIFNLLINSSQALSENKVENSKIDILISESSQNILIDIIDNGPGVPDNLKSNIFKPFFTTKETGTGLGLAICKNLTKKINSDISLVSNNNGAHFQISIPKVHNENPSR